MQRIAIKDFSCIKSADIQLTPLTIIIGPQASGKSVLSKLIYFCTSVITDYDNLLVYERLTVDELNKSFCYKFTEWFPTSAWGDKRFNIEYQLSEFSLKITRIEKSDRVRIIFGEKFSRFYEELSHRLASLSDLKKSKEPDSYEASWQFQQYAESAMRKWLGPQYIETQLFIPAGRSFFTSIGKALVAFEQSGILDPVTLEFGRRFSSMRERYFRRTPANINSISPSPLSPAGILFSEILGGTLKYENGKEYIQTPDGRLIPFSALSSGQQELLPLAMAIRAMLPSADDEVRRLTGGGRLLSRTIYIEEPEAHLFPRAQNKLVEILAAIVTRRRNTNLLITTHSPYVLSKLNNLIKAGALSRKSKTDPAALKEIVPNTSWLIPKSVNAYAIKDNKLINIMDNSGLIAADYLDDVSGEIAVEFSKLMALELGL